MFDVLCAACGPEPVHFSDVVARGEALRRERPRLHCADGEEERRAERHWRQIPRRPGEFPELPEPPEDRERWRERPIS